MQTILRRSGLVVAQEGGDEAWLQRALEQIDERLILTREVDRMHGRYVWNVHVNWSSDRPAIHVLSWRDPDGTPRPLGSLLIEEVKARLNADPDAGRRADDANARLVAQVDKEIDEASSEAARLVARFGNAGHSPVFHRGVHLRRARARYRRDGR